MPPRLSPVLIIPDVHVPYHDTKAWKLMLKVGAFFKPKYVIVLGDFGDFYAVSDFQKDPSRASQLDVEVEACNEALDQLDALGASNKYFIAGNHCARLERYLKTRAPELFSMIKVEQLFKLRQRNWKYTPYRDDVRIGKVYFTHDIGVAGRTTVFKTLDTYQHSIITGHTHRLAYVVEGNATGESILSAQFGWLGDVSKVDYMHRIKAEKDWALGFGVGYFREDNGFMYLQPVPIVEYSCVVEGRLFTTESK